MSCPSILTYPPRGTALNFQRVPCRSLNPNNSGPNPTENTSTRTPGPTGHPEMAEFVDEHQDRQDEQEREKVVDQKHMLFILTLTATSYR